MKQLALILLILVANANAEDCSQKEQQKTDDLVAEYPLDDYAVKLAALRTGLCHYVEQKKITEERAGKIIEIEREKMKLEKLAIKKDLIT